MQKISKPYPKFNILSFGIEDKDVGSSSTLLLQRFKISKLLRLANPGGTSKIKNTIGTLLKIKLSQL